MTDSAGPRIPTSDLELVMAKVLVAIREKHGQALDAPRYTLERQVPLGVARVAADRAGSVA